MELKGKSFKEFKLPLELRDKMFKEHKLPLALKILKEPKLPLELKDKSFKELKLPLALKILKEPKLFLALIIHKETKLPPLEFKDKSFKELKLHLELRDKMFKEPKLPLEFKILRETKLLLEVKVKVPLEHRLPLEFKDKTSLERQGKPLLKRMEGFLPVNLILISNKGLGSVHRLGPLFQVNFQNQKRFRNCRLYSVSFSNPPFKRHGRFTTVPQKSLSDKIRGKYQRFYFFISDYSSIVYPAEMRKY